MSARSPGGKAGLGDGTESEGGVLAKTDIGPILCARSAPGEGCPARSHCPVRFSHLRAVAPPSIRVSKRSAIIHTSGEMALQVDVPKLVHRSHLPQHSPMLVRVGEEGHEVAGNVVAGG